jgi:hypothetical protein
LGLPYTGLSCGCLGYLSAQHLCPKKYFKSKEIKAISSAKIQTQKVLSTLYPSKLVIRIAVIQGEKNEVVCIEEKRNCGEPCLKPTHHGAEEENKKHLRKESS